MSRCLAACLALLTVAAADTGPLPHASGAPDGPGPGCGGGFTAARGDTLYSIARRCETSVAELVQENRLGRGQALETGQRLAIPGFAADEAGKPPEAEPPEAGVEVPVVRPHVRPRLDPPPPLRVRPDRPGPPPPRLPAPPPPPRVAGDIYHFQPGDTLYSLARWARVTLPALLAANPDVAARDIEIGDPIRLPRGAARPEPMRLRERGRTPPATVVPPILPPATTAPVPPRPPRPPAVRPPAPQPDMDKPDADDEDDELTPGGMDNGEPEPDGM